MEAGALSSARGSVVWASTDPPDSFRDWFRFQASKPLLAWRCGCRELATVPDVPPVPEPDTPRVRRPPDDPSVL